MNLNFGGFFSGGNGGTEGLGNGVVRRWFGNMVMGFEGSGGGAPAGSGGGRFGNGGGYGDAWGGR